MATSSSVTTEQLQSADTRLCGDPSKFIERGKGMLKIKKRAPGVCAVCGKPSCRICTLCKDPKHKDGVPPQKPPTSSDKPTCFCQCHNTLFCGLAKRNTALAGTKRKDCACPTDQAIADHRDTIKRLCQGREQVALQLTNRVDNDENAEVQVVAGRDVSLGDGIEHARI